MTVKTIPTPDEHKQFIRVWSDVMAETEKLNQEGPAPDPVSRPGAPAAIAFAAVLLGLTLCPVVLVLWGMVR